MTTNRYALALDLKNDPALIAKYVAYHTDGQAWPEITASIKSAGIEDMEIYLSGNRLFMMMETNEHFSFDEKAKMDAADPHVQKWETLMAEFQLPLPWAEPGEKWVKMTRVYKLPE